jgi:multidrug resistance protein, MATE family
VTLLVALTRHAIPYAFLGTSAAGAAEVAALASMLLVLGMSFFIADGIQTVANGALRGLNDTRIPLLFSGISFWGIAFPTCYALAFWAGWGAIGVWIGLSIGLTVYAGLLIWRFYALSQESYLPELPPGA